MRAPWFPLLAAPALLLAASCGGDDDDDDGSAEDTGGQLTRLGDQAVNDRGTSDASGVSELEFATGDFYFEPTFVRGTPGQRLTLRIENHGAVIHNLSLPGTDVDVMAGETREVEVTFPQNGVALFLCNFHSGQGMVGELLVGDARPTAVAIPSPAASPAATTGSDPYNPY